VTRGSSPGRSPTPGLLIGLVLTLAAVVVYSWSVNREMTRLRALQTDLVDRNRKDSLQLLRVQNNLNLLGLAMRDVLDGTQPYPIAAWSAQFDRIHRDLDDALSREAEVGAGPAPADRQRLLESLDDFWRAVDRTFALAAAGDEDRARDDIRLTLQARQASLTTSVARLLVANNESEEEAAARVQAIYDQVQRQGDWLLGATLLVIAATGLYVIAANRRLFAEMTALSDGRRELAQQLIATRESTLHHVSRELHDELGQILTAMGSMLARAERRAADDPLRGDLREISEMAQRTLTNVRGLSQMLHPSILDELGLESAVEAYVAAAGRQLGLDATFTREGRAAPIDATVAIHVYRVLQEALTNAARHSGARTVEVRLRYTAGALELEVEDHGSGLDARATRRRGLGLVAMRERAELVGGTLTFARPDAGGTLVRLRVPFDDAEAQAS
jgi:signal transduction histidine kinase